MVTRFVLLNTNSGTKALKKQPYHIPTIGLHDMASVLSAELGTLFGPPKAALN